MELALYGPDGYYHRPRPIGKSGDFFTSVSVGPLFGQLLAFQFAQWFTPWPDEPLEIIEAGAHDATLALDLLRYFQRYHPQVARRLRYGFFEPLPALRRLQKTRAGSFARHLRWIRSWDQVTPGAAGPRIIFSNEFLDAMPVHRLAWDACTQSWFEWGVCLEKRRLVWAKLPMPALPARDLEGLSPHPDNGAARELFPHLFTVEVSPRAEQWWNQAAAHLGSGYLVTIDYGFTDEQRVGPKFPHGTLRGYRQHHLETDLLSSPGEVDLTAHVNFSALERAGAVAGMITQRHGLQRQWLTELAAATWAHPQQFPPWTAGSTRQFQTLTHPEHLGDKFRVLVQARLPSS